MIRTCARTQEPGGWLFACYVDVQGMFWVLQPQYEAAVCMFGSCSLYLSRRDSISRALLYGPGLCVVTHWSFAPPRMLSVDSGFPF